MAARIAAHKRERPPSGDGRGAARARRCARVRSAAGTALVDCLTLWVANRGGADSALEAAQARDGLTIAVSNEVGLGIVSATRWPASTATCSEVSTPLGRGGRRGVVRRRRESTLSSCRERPPTKRAASPDAKTKPRGSLGRLEELGCRIAEIRGFVPSSLQSVIVVAAGDHGVAREGVSAYPSDVTKQMVANFEAGGAAINVLARRAGAELRIVDAGVGTGTANMLETPAMTAEQVGQALADGEALAAALDADVVGLGEMGIGNTTSAAALTSALLGVVPELVCGRGTGLDDDGVLRKIDVVRRAVALHADADPLTALGGFESKQARN